MAYDKNNTTTGTVSRLVSIEFSKISQLPEHILATRSLAFNNLSDESRAKLIVDNKPLSFSELANSKILTSYDATSSLSISGGWGVDRYAFVLIVATIRNNNNGNTIESHTISGWVDDVDGLMLSANGNSHRVLISDDVVFNVDNVVTRFIPASGIDVITDSYYAVGKSGTEISDTIKYVVQEEEVTNIAAMATSYRSGGINPMISSENSKYAQDSIQIDNGATMLGVASNILLGAYTVSTGGDQYPTSDARSNQMLGFIGKASGKSIDQDGRTYHGKVFNWQSFKDFVELPVDLHGAITLYDDMAMPPIAFDPTGAGVDIARSGTMESEVHNVATSEAQLSIAITRQIHAYISKHGVGSISLYYTSTTKKAFIISLLYSDRHAPTRAETEMLEAYISKLITTELIQDGNIQLLELRFGGGVCVPCGMFISVNGQPEVPYIYGTIMASMLNDCILTKTSTDTINSQVSMLIQEMQGIDHEHERRLENHMRNMDHSKPFGYIDPTVTAEVIVPDYGFGDEI